MTLTQTTLQEARRLGTMMGEANHRRDWALVQHFDRYFARWAARYSRAEQPQLRLAYQQAAKEITDAYRIANPISR